jgi:hypothetical protein
MRVRTIFARLSRLMFAFLAALSLATCSNPSGSSSDDDAEDTQAPSVGTAISFSGTSSSATTLSWGAASDKVTIASKLRYEVVEASSGDAIDTVSEAKAITTAAKGLVMDWTANTLTVSATGLSGSTTYYFAVLVEDAAGNMSLYAPQSVTTSAAADTTAPTIGTAIGFSSTSSMGTTVSWGAATDDVTSAASLKYKVVRASSSSAIDTVTEADAITTSSAGLAMDWTANTTSVAASGLSELTAYCFAVLVKDAAGNASLYAPASVTTVSSLVVRYRFENNGNDSVGSYNLTAGGSPTYSSSITKEGAYSVSFNGSSYLCNNSTSISVPSGMTVSAWVYCSNLSNYPSVINVYGTVDDEDYCYYLAFYTDCISLDDYYCVAQRGACDLASSTWYHVAFTMDANKNLVLYLNGSAIASSDSATYYLSTIRKVAIGMRENDLYWNGYIDDVRIYDKVLSASEIAALYASY